MNIYVGNLPFELSEDELSDVFGAFGEVSSAKIITDRYSGRPRGFAFVEMPDDSHGKAAIDDLNEKEFKGRTLKVSVARASENRPERRPRDDMS